MGEASETLLLEAQSLTKVYGLVMGVNDVSFKLPRGVYGLLGPNGAGKSTLLNLITGQLRPSDGTIRVLGENPWNNRALMQRIGFCPEQDAFYDFLSARQFVTLLARMSGLAASEAGDRAQNALDRCGCQAFIDRPISTYSRGQRQRTKVAQALVHDPELIILDEPLTGTDPVGRHELMDLVRGFSAEGRSVIVSSHVLHEVAAMTNQFVLIYSGRVLATGDVHEIRALMNQFPHRVRIRCERPHALARQLMRDLPLEGVDIDGERDTLLVHTRAVADFYAGVPAAALAADAGVREMISQDDNLEAVFNYLIGGAGV
jgi:ABC-2 type transport system ATP-binding protein